MALTVKDALKSEVTYPLPDGFYEKTLVMRELDGGAPFTREIGVSGSFRLAYADCLVRHAAVINMSEAELSFSAQQELKSLLAMANGIYRQHGEDEVSFDSEPVATVTYIGESWG